ncbi:LolA family protein [Crassaminicella indica]|uniref:Outer-membrane lipoprotein carrier protein LolA n=1 Tax=Crassaminicella indica TaxID=2855394 RepID=A0ABX8R931_9CLOT|nr:outer-membrane lipoprotein carrier protein LolA [Crassaminicella indica]QXM05311.1 outer-membrane lipoprotein carrier protein LolA [Crassaminicella indica]
MMRGRGIILSIFIILLITGCAPKTEQDIFYDVQKKLHKMESYTCRVEITSIGNKGSQKYVMKQWFKKPNRYKLEVISPENLKGKITLSNGKKVWIYHPGIEQTWITDEFSNEEQNLFLGYFIKNFLNSEQVNVNVEGLDDKKYFVIDTDIPGNHAYYHKERLWIDMEKMQPYLLEVFDVKGDKRIEVKYEVFEYNPKLKEELFYFQADD